MISIIGSYLQLVENFLQQNKAIKVNLLSLPPGALAVVIVQIFAESRHSESKAVMCIVAL